MTLIIGAELVTTMGKGAFTPTAAGPQWRDGYD